MTSNSKGMVENLKSMIDKNGPDYLFHEPYSVYKELIVSDSGMAATAGAILLTLVRGVVQEIKSNNDTQDLSTWIRRECMLNSEMSDIVAGIFNELYSKDNELEWESNKLNGWKAFAEGEFYCEWKGFSVWRVDGGSVDCHYESEIIMEYIGTVKPDEKLSQALERNPFMTAEAIAEYYRKKIREYLDMEFEEYCTCEDYYQPVVEDFEIDYRVKQWCDENGFKMVSCEGSGEDGGYEPSFRNGIY